MKSISDLKWVGKILSWKVNGEAKQTEFSHDVENAVVLHSEGIAVIEGNDWNAQASLLNADGSQRALLKNPFRPEEGLAFYYFNYEGEHLVVILAGAARDFAYRVDETTGTLSAPHEAR
jgi:hypothetical protein